jgi:membrane protease YdiL (CAAX protease family)
MAMWVVPGPIGQAAYGICKLWMAAFPLAWTLLVDKERLSWSRPRHGGLLTGIVFGLLVGALILAAYVLVGKRWIDADALRLAAQRNGLDSRAVYLGFAAYLILVNSLAEEYVWRWFVFRKCELLLPGWIAVLASAAMFTVHHVFALRAQLGWGVTLLGSAGVFVGGALWSGFYRRYRSIWPGYVCHALVDVAVLVIGWWLIFA